MQQQRHGQNEHGDEVVYIAYLTHGRDNGDEHEAQYSRKDEHQRVKANTLRLGCGADAPKAYQRAYDRRQRDIYHGLRPVARVGDEDAEARLILAEAHKVVHRIAAGHERIRKKLVETGGKGGKQAQRAYQRRGGKGREAAPVTSARMS